MGTLNQFALWSRKDIDDQTDDTREHNEQHPKHGVVHASIFCISGDPHEKRNVQCEYQDRTDDEEHGASRAPGATDGATGSTSSIIDWMRAPGLRHERQRGDQNVDNQ